MMQNKAMLLHPGRLLHGLQLQEQAWQQPDRVTQEVTQCAA